MIYLNNAGTTWPKPEVVNSAMKQFIELTPDKWLQVFNDGIGTATSFFGINNPDRFLFTQSCTQSMAIAFSDFPWEKGDRLIISEMEHHALSRWMYKLQREQGVDGTLIPRNHDGPLDLNVLEKELKKGARMVAMSMASNVTGEVLPYEEVLDLCRKYEAVSLLDGAQLAGLIPIDIRSLDPDIFVFAGHKAPLGPQGIGGLYISENVSMVCPSAACEITPGLNKSAIFPTYCDTGSAPMGAIAGLSAGLNWIEDYGWDQLVSQREMLSKKLREGLQAIDSIEIVGAADYERYTGAVSIGSSKLSLAEINEKLWKENEIKGSYGFQCAPLAHEALRTHEKGTLRFSVGPLNTLEDVDELLDTLKLIVTR